MMVQCSSIGCILFFDLNEPQVVVIEDVHHHSLVFVEEDPKQLLQLVLGEGQVDFEEDHRIQVTIQSHFFVAAHLQLLEVRMHLEAESESHLLHFCVVATTRDHHHERESHVAPKFLGFVPMNQSLDCYQSLEDRLETPLLLG